MAMTNGTFGDNAPSAGRRVIPSSLKHAVMAVLLATVATPARAADIAADPVPVAVAPASEGGFRFLSWTEPCAMTCSVTGYAGVYVATAMTSLFVKGRVFAPWTWDTKDSQFIGASASRKFATYDDLWDLEGEVGLGKRFGDLQAGEGWVAMYARWNYFPWNDYIRTTAAISTGLNYATKIDRVEDEKSSKNSHLLHYLAPELTFGLPDQPNWNLVLRFHHRSGGKLGVFNGTSGGAQYQTIGVRYTW